MGASSTGLKAMKGFRPSVSEMYGDKVFRQPNAADIGRRGEYSLVHFTVYKNYNHYTYYWLGDRVYP
jgi:hypothetical protein